MTTAGKTARLRQSKTYLPDQEREELLQFAQVLNGINIAVGEPGQEAADFRGMSRPTFVKILQSGAIPFEMAGRHRRVTLRGVVDYQERGQRERRAALAELAKDSMEHYDKLPKGVPCLKRRPRSSSRPRTLNP